MCGLITMIHHGKRKNDPVNELVINQFEDQKERGVNGFGVVPIIIGQPIRVKRATEITKALIDLYLNPANMMMFHHRIPTSSDNKIGQTHPIEVTHESFKSNYLVIHNGVIGNASDLQKEHKAEGYLYTTLHLTEYKVEKFNDSESLAIELALHLEGKRQTLKARGSAAFIVLECSKEWLPLKIHFGRNDSNPLNLASSRDFIYLSSAGKGDEVKPFRLYTGDLTKEIVTLTSRDFKMTEAIISTTPIATADNYGWGSYYRSDGVYDKHGRYQGHGHRQGIQTTYKKVMCENDRCTKDHLADSLYCLEHRPEMGFKTVETRSDIEATGTTIDTKERTPSTVETEELAIEERAIAEEKAEEDANTACDEAYEHIDAIMREFLEAVEDDHIPNPKEYMALIDGLLTRACDKVIAKIKLQAPHIDLNSLYKGFGKAALDAESILIYDEVDTDYSENFKTEKEQNEDFERQIQADVERHTGKREPHQMTLEDEPFIS